MTLTSTPVPNVLVALLLVAGLVACQPQDPRSSESAVDTTAIMASLDSLRTAFEDAVAAGDFREQAAVYATKAIFSPPMAPPVRGRDSIQSHIQRTAPPEATLDIQPIDARVLSPNWAYEYGTGTLSFTPEGATAPQETQTTYFALFRKTEAGWRIHREVLNLNQPPSDL